MCAVGRDLDSSIAAGAPTTAVPGVPSIGAGMASTSVRPVRKQTLLTSGRQTTAPGGTLLTGPGGGSAPSAKPVPR